RDKRNTAALTWERVNATSEIAFGGYLRHESLTQDGVNGTLSQDIGSYFIRGGVQPSTRLRVQGGIFASHYTTFGSNFDGRIGASYDLSADDVLRGSVGTGFRAPLLIERYVVPVDELPLDVNCVAVGQGNADEKPEHATEYELGYAHRFNTNANIDVALYRTNLRDPIENFYPLGASCPASSPPLQSFPINVGNVVYQGAEIHLTRRIRHVSIEAAYGLNVAYPFNFPTTISNPTSGGNLVENQQFLNIPQQQGALGVAYDNAPWHAALQTYVRGKNNELNQGPFAVVNAAVGKRSGNFDVTVAGTNLTNAVAGRFTLPGLGVPYRGLVTEPDGSTGFGDLPTDALFLQPAGVRLILTVRK
ncbi:MAG: TonB-dependent receptor, partial [Candidatus Eremiobacteraeota bacterium]|nr:TonB-dependent receptor [Candidatus Eremiobacteraeota bacterium]